MATLIEVAPGRETGKGAGRVLTMSTIAFTLLFAVWLMFGILGVPIQEELNLDDVQLSWISAVTFFVATVHSYGAVLLIAFLVGFAGNLFSVGTAWNASWYSRDQQGFALGVFGAGNVGASVTKFIGPPLIVATAGSTYVLGVQGGWRLIPVIYAVLLIIVGFATWALVLRVDRAPGASRTIASMLAPLKQVRVWRFSLYYVAVFGAYVALSAWLPKYYVDNFAVTFLVFLLGCAMGFGKAAVFKHIPEYFPDNVGSVGGLVGMLGGLGGFVLPPLFAYTKDWSGFPTSTFFVIFVLTALCAVWMHVTIVRMLDVKSPELAGNIEPPVDSRGAAL